jgi:hypothetical protein
MGVRCVTTSPEVSDASKQAGLRTCERAVAGSYCPRFPTRRSVLDVEVVLAYRCGAVLASHQVPFSADVDRGLDVSTSLDM